MSGNTVLINNAIEFYVGDSNMPELMNYLTNKGFPLNKEAKKHKKMGIDLAQSKNNVFSGNTIR